MQASHATSPRLLNTNLQRTSDQISPNRGMAITSGTSGYSLGDVRFRTCTACMIAMILATNDQWRKHSKARNVRNIAGRMGWSKCAVPTIFSDLQIRVTLAVGCIFSRQSLICWAHALPKSNMLTLNAHEWPWSPESMKRVAKNCFLCNAYWAFERLSFQGAVADMRLTEAWWVKTFPHFWEPRCSTAFNVLALLWFSTKLCDRSCLPFEQQEKTQPWG